jgi:hypothetical protein
VELLGILRSYWRLARPVAWSGGGLLGFWQLNSRSASPFFIVMN